MAAPGANLESTPSKLIARKQSSPAKKTGKEELEIPKTPSAPPPLLKKVPLELSHHCQRKFSYKGKLLACDSSSNQDGEGLRLIVQEVPDAVAELDNYQQGRRELHALTYMGTTGVVIAATGWLFLGKQFEGLSGAAVRNVTVGTGLWILAVALLSGIDHQEKNEAHLGNAVQLYNQARPDSPIEVQLSTSVSF
jgi:hypothetical protein